MMDRKWALLKSSDIGPMGRGQNGKKKIYEVSVQGQTLICSWGMAEKPNRQKSVEVFYSKQAAIAAAYSKVRSKTDRGYEVAYVV